MDHSRDKSSRLKALSSASRTVAHLEYTQSKMHYEWSEKRLRGFLTLGYSRLRLYLHATDTTGSMNSVSYGINQFHSTQ